jgi:hypothetical protein
LVVDAFTLLAIAVGACALAILLKDLLMVDVVGLNAQVDETIRTMAAAVSQLQADVAALSVAEKSGDAEAVAASVARLKAGTDSLAAAVAMAK